MAESGFNYGSKNLTLKELQRFGDVATGWSVVILDLKNELKTIDIFIVGIDGGIAIDSNLKNEFRTDEANKEEEQTWHDLWSFFEHCWWLYARLETWNMKFGGYIWELLLSLDRLSFPHSIARLQKNPISSRLIPFPQSS